MAKSVVIAFCVAVASVVGCLQLGCAPASAWTKVSSGDVSKESLKDNVYYLTNSFVNHENETLFTRSIETESSTKVDICSKNYIISNGKNSLLVLIGLGGVINGYLGVACLVHSQ